MVETEKGRFTLPAEPDGALTSREDLPEYLAALTGREAPVYRADAAALPPLEKQEVWAAGVTYFRSRTARMEESKAASGSSFYDLVYNAERPELFFKAAPWRVVGSGGTVRIRRDARWSVPEPELVLLISPNGRILGYTAGNDMSSRDIEGENPLYLPQAKVYDGSCSLGPSIRRPRGSDCSGHSHRHRDPARRRDGVHREHVRFRDETRFPRRSSSISTGRRASRTAACSSPEPASFRLMGSRSSPATRSS